ncbi:MAG: patatin-like protein [Chloroflexota bacterium]
MTQTDGQASNDPFENEIRFAVVMYGGISLAIYIHGVSQELFRMVRATASDSKQVELDPIEKVYRRLGERLKTKFVVDVLSGTSAGGINAVYLSKALVENHRDLSLIERVWVHHADIAALIDDEQSHEEYPELMRSAKPSSLLNNQVFYYRLLDALHEMNKVRADGEVSTLVEELDLYITATNLAGDPITKEIENTRFEELQFKSAFHFRYGGRADRDHDFRQDHNPFLAFAARCTAAIPPAFQPMNLKDIEDVIKLPRFNGRYVWGDEARKRRIVSRWNQQTSPSNLEESYYGDGGYLDNKPFSYAVQDLYRPESGRRVDRKLLYIEPHPEHLKTPSGDRPDLIDNVLKATVILPRYETIQEDIDRIEVRNRVVNMLRGVLGTEVNDPEHAQKGLEGILRGIDEPDSNVAKALYFRSGANDFARMNLLELTDKRGIAYYQYILIRAQSVIENIGDLMVRIRKAKPGSWEARRIHECVQRFIMQEYLSEGPDKTVSKFLVENDYQWHLRRLQFFIHKLEEIIRNGDYKAIRSASGILYQDLIERLPKSVKRSSREYKLLCGTETGEFDWKDEFENLLRKDICAFKVDYRNVYRAYRSLLNGESIAGNEPLRAQILDIFSDHRISDPKYTPAEALREPMKHLSHTATGLFKRLRFAKYFHPLTADADGAERLFIRYFHGYFEAMDMLTFPIYYSNRIDVRRIDQPDPLEVIRVSPEDGRNIEEIGDASEKLAGTRIAHFGGFFKKEWRENDILWGRLDAAEILIKGVTKGTNLMSDEEVREIINEAQAEILRSYYLKIEPPPTVLTASQVLAQTQPGAEPALRLPRGAPILENLEKSINSQLTRLHDVTAALRGFWQEKLTHSEVLSFWTRLIPKPVRTDDENRAILDYHRQHSRVDPRIPPEEEIALAGRSVQTLGGILETLAEGRGISSKWPKRVSLFAQFLGTLVRSSEKGTTAGAVIFGAIFVEMALGIIALLTGWGALKWFTLLAFFFTVITAITLQQLGRLRTGQPLALGNLGTNLSIVARMALTLLAAAIIWLVLINIPDALTQSSEFLEKFIVPNISMIAANRGLTSLADFLWPIPGILAVTLLIALTFLRQRLAVDVNAPGGVRDLATANSVKRVEGILDAWGNSNQERAGGSARIAKPTGNAKGEKRAHRMASFSWFIGLDFLFALLLPLGTVQLWLRLSLPRYSTEASGSLEPAVLFLITIGIVLVFFLAMISDTAENLGLARVRAAYHLYRPEADAYARLTPDSRNKTEHPEFRKYLSVSQLRRLRNAALWKETFYFLGIALFLGGAFLIADTLVRWVIGLSIGTLISAGYMGKTRSRIRIVPLELALLPARAERIINEWRSIANSQGIADARTNVLRDFIFIPFYAGTLIVLAYLAGQNLAAAAPFNVSGTWIIWAIATAGIFDVVENLLMLQMLKLKAVPGSLSLATTFFAVIKFVLAGFASLYVLWWLVPALLRFFRA